MNNSLIALAFGPLCGPVHIEKTMSNQIHTEYDQQTLDSFSQLGLQPKVIQPLADWANPLSTTRRPPC